MRPLQPQVAHNHWRTALVTGDKLQGSTDTKCGAAAAIQSSGFGSDQFLLRRSNTDEREARLLPCDESRSLRTGKEIGCKTHRGTVVEDLQAGKNLSESVDRLLAAPDHPNPISVPYHTLEQQKR